MMKASDYVLYYPYIEFRNEDWVKSSLLLWDKVYRIVPIDYPLRDSRVIQEAVENDLIRNVTLEKEDITKTGDQFIKFCNQLPFLPAGLDVSEYHRIHPDKIDSRLYPSLENIARKIDNEGFLRLSPELARGYMFYLSKIVAERRGLVRATDDRDSWTISPYFIEEANFNEYVCNNEANGFYCSLIISDLIPANISEIPINRIIEFVEKRRELKADFRQLISQFVHELSEIESNEHAKALINDFKNGIELSKTELRKSMDFCNQDDISSLLTMGVPVSLTAFGAFAVLGDPFSLYKVFSSVLIGAVAAYSDYKKTKKGQRENSYASYLVDLDEELSKKKSVPIYSRIFEEFMND